MASTDDLIDASATQLAGLIQSKQASSYEVVSACLVRIEAVNPKLNAVVLLTAEQALEAARRADAALARGKVIGPLHGVPMTIKDAFETAGVISTGGTLGRAKHVPAEDAPTVARLRAAGGIMLGKTNLPELSMGSESTNLVYGQTNNPYDLSRVPGGSTGGEAAIIAAGGSPCGLGSDAGGSIRVPCHFCGIAGIKPTYGRVPTTGDWPWFPHRLIAVGPMARRVEDLALLLPILAGPDGRDADVVPMPLSDPAAVQLRGLRVALYTDNGVARVTPETDAAVRAAGRALEEAGAVVEEDCPPNVAESHELMMGLFGGDGGEWCRAALEEAGTTRIHPLLEDRLRIMQPSACSSAELTRLVKRCDAFRSRMLAFMQRYDAILCPVYAEPAPPHGTTQAPERIRAGSYARTYNLTGYPGAVVRGGTSPEGLPIGVQLVARPWREDVALALAQHIDTALGGWQRPAL